MQQIVADVIRDEVDDRSIGFLTITDVEVSADLRNATVYYSVLGPPEQIEATRQGLARARKFINVRLGEQIETKYTPQLRFVLDETAQRAQRIEKALREIHEQLPAETEADQEPEPGLE